MSNEAVRWFRQQSPNTTLTDEQITLKVYQLGRSDERFRVFENDPTFLEQARSLDKEIRLDSAPGIFGEASKALQSGIDSTQSRFFDTLAMVGQATGVDTLRDFGLRKSQENLEAAAENAPTLPDFSEVENIGEGIRYLVGLAGSQAPQLAAVIGAGAAGLAAGGAPVAAALTGATAFTQTQNYGDLIRQGVPADEALRVGFGTGVISAALESITPALVVTPLFRALKQAGAQQVARGVLAKVPESQLVATLRSAAKSAGVDGVSEAATEAAQEAVTIASEIYANRNNPDFEITDEDINRRILNAAVAGGALGGGIGAGVGAVTAPRAGATQAPEPAQPTVTATSASPAAEVATETDRTTGAESVIPTLRTDDGLYDTAEDPGTTPFDQFVEGNQPARSTEIEVEVRDPAVVDGQDGTVDIVHHAPEPVQQETEEQLQEEVTPEPPPPTPAVVPGTVVATAESSERLLAGLDTDTTPIVEQGEAPKNRARLPMVAEIDRDTPVEDLLDGHRTKQGSGVTRKIIFFEDNSETGDGRVIGLPIFVQPVKGQGNVVKVSRPADVFVNTNQDGTLSKRQPNSVPLDQLLAMGTLEPINMIRLNEASAVRGTNPDSVVYFDDAAALNELLIRPAKGMLANLKASAASVVSTTADVGKASGSSVERNAVSINEIENTLATDPESVEDDFQTLVGLVEERIPEGVPLDAGSVAIALREVADGPDASFALDFYRQVIASSGLVDDKAFKDALQDEQKAIISQRSAEAFLAAKGSVGQITGRDGDSARGDTQGGEGAVRQGEGGVSEEQAQRRFLSLRVDQGYTATTPSHVVGAFGRAKDALIDAGIPVSVESALEQEFGQFSPQDKSVILALRDATSPTLDNFRLLLHEAAHALASTLPPDVYAAVMRGVSRYSREKLNQLHSNDPRIRQENPANLDPALLAEEIFAESLAQEFANQEVSRTLAARIFRMIREMVTRMAMAVQRMFGREPSIAVAESYARTRFEQLIGGDGNGIIGHLVPDFNPSVDVVGAEDRFSVGAEGRADARRTQNHLRIATANEESAILRQIALEAGSLESVQQYAKNREVTPEDAVRTILGIDDPQEGVAALVASIDPSTGQPSGLNADHRLADFKGQSIRHRAIREAFKVLNRRLSKVMARHATATSKVSGLKSRLETEATRRQEAHAAFKDRARTANLVRRGIAQLMRESLADVDQIRFKFGAITAELARMAKGLTKREMLATYGPALRELAAMAELPQKFNVLKFFETVMKDGSVDLFADMDQVVADLVATGNPQYDILTKNTPQAQALLATLVAYAKRDRQLLENYRIETVEGAAAQNAIRERLAKILSDTGSALNTGLSEMGDAVKQELEARTEYLKAAQQVRSIRGSLNRWSRVADVGDAAIKVYQRSIAPLAGELGVHAQFVYSDGATYLVPASPEATSDEVRQSTQKLKLDTNGDVTKMSELNDHLSSMVAWLEVRSRDGNLDQTYWDVHHQYNELAKAIISREQRKSLGYVWTTRWTSITDTLRRFGTNFSRDLGRMINGFVGENRQMKVKTERLQRDINRKWDRLHGVLKKAGISVDMETFEARFYNPSVEFLSKQDDLNDTYQDPETRWEVAMNRLSGFLNDTVGRQIPAAQSTPFHQAFKDLLASVKELNDLYVREIEDGEYGDTGVIDRELSILDRAGSRVPAVRRRVQRGVMTVPRRVSGTGLQLFKTMSSLPGGEWQAFRQATNRAMEAYRDGGSAAAWEILQPYFNSDLVQAHFLNPIFDSESEANILPAPNSSYELGPLEDVVAEAWANSGGNVVAALEAISQAHGNDPSVTEAWIEDALGEMNGLYRQLRSTLRETMPKEVAAYIDVDSATADNIMGGRSWASLVPGVMIFARKIDHWPSAWFQNVYYNDATIASTNARIAAQKVFGLNNARLEKAYNGLKRELDARVAPLREAEERAAINGLTRAEKESFLEEALGSKEEVARLRQLRDLENRTITGNDSIAQGLWRFFHGKESPTEDLVLYRELVGALTGAIVNQPASALLQTNEILGPILNFGVSRNTVKQVGRMSAQAVRNLAGGLLNAVGINWQRTNEDIRRYHELGLNDPVLHVRLSDLVLRPNREVQSFSDRVATITRRLSELREFSVKRGDSTNTPLRPLAPFSQYAQVLNEAIIVNNWRVVKEYLGKAMESGAWTGDNAQADMTVADWAAAMNLPVDEKHTFTEFFRLLEDEYGLTMFNLLKDAEKNRDLGLPMLSDRTSYMLAGMALTKITQEGNIANMPIGAFNNPVIRGIMPLLGWPYRQALKVSNKILKNDGDRFTMQGLARASMAMAVFAGGGLGISMAVDAYSEELLRKKRNLVPLNAAERSAQALAVLEHLTRVGTFGLLGDFAVEAINVGTGEGDLRGMSVDRRVLAINSAQSLVRSFSAFLNQGFEADYNGVVRPVLFALGGNGALQAIQVVNTVGGFDNVESRSVRRTNVNNWLRAAGRISGVELRRSSSGFGTPTTITPHITRMLMSALANDAAGFAVARREAIQAARLDGKDDPESYVTRTFSSRDPLQIFRTKPTVGEMNKILAKLPPDGRRDVVQALRMFEHYKGQLGGSSSGRQTTAQQRPGGLFNLNL